jgi:hypothetical protein
MLLLDLRQRIRDIGQGADGCIHVITDKHEQRAAEARAGQLATRA